MNVDVKNDLNSMKSELANFSAEIKDAFSALELETTKHSTEPIPLVNCSTQTESQPKSRVLPQPNVSKDSSCSEASEPADLSSCREAQTSTSNLSSVEDRGFKEKEAKYKKDIFDLKVKLKELEVKMNHIKKKADEMKNDSKDQTLSENLSNDKVISIPSDIGIVKTCNPNILCTMELNDLVFPEIFDVIVMVNEITMQHLKILLNLYLLS